MIIKVYIKYIIKPKQETTKSLFINTTSELFISIDFYFTDVHSFSYYTKRLFLLKKILLGINVKLFNVVIFLKPVNLV